MTTAPSIKPPRHIADDDVEPVTLPDPSYVRQVDGIRMGRIVCLLVLTLFLATSGSWRGMHEYFFPRNAAGVSGLMHYAFGHYAKAAKAYREALRGRKSSDDALVKRALQLVQDNQPDAALKITEEYIREQPDRFAGYFVAALAHWLKRDIVATTDFLNFSVRRSFATRHPEVSPETFVRLIGLLGEILPDGKRTDHPALAAVIFRVLGILHPARSKTAQTWAKKAIGRGDFPDVAYHTLAMAAVKRSEYESALALLKKGEALNPNNTEILRLQAYILSELGEVAGEAKAIHRAMILRPSDPVYANYFDYLYIQKIGDLHTARQVFEANLANGDQTQPNRTTLARLAYLYGQLGLYPKGAEAYQRLVKLEPQNADYRFSLADAFARANDRVSAKREFLIMTATFPEDSRGHAGLGRQFAEEMNTRKAIASMERAFALRHQSIEDLSLLCAYYRYANEYETALQCLRRVLAFDPTDSHASRLIAETENAIRIKGKTP